jgi:hypothetical protein
MSQLLLKILDRLGRLKINLHTPAHKGWESLPPPLPTSRLDAQGGLGWKEVYSPKALFEVWGPLRPGPWEYYHTVPLFAALTDLAPSSSGKTEIFAPPSEEELRNISQQVPILGDNFLDEKWGVDWFGQRLMVIIDLPGVQSVPASVRFIRAGFQPICTFDNWPHPKGLLKPELILGQLLRYATTVRLLRPGFSPTAPPVLITDNLRLGTMLPSVNDFDNRYFLDDSILPSLEILRREDIRGIVCVLTTPMAVPSGDLCFYFRSLKKSGFRDIYRCDISDPKMSSRPLLDTEMPEHFSDAKFKFAKSNAGGFGRLIPEPSSGGG